MTSNIDNFSKQLSNVDDSAAKLLIDLLGGNPGRNFDVESIFSFKTDNGWGWLIFEFLKKDSIHLTIEQSHPNRYWKKNNRKFLSLWALAKSLEAAGFVSALWLINYDDERSKIKLMKVKDINVNSTEIWSWNSKETKHINHIVTEDEVMSFDEFKDRFQNFNNSKKGDSWEIIEFLRERTID
ncbi:hypothetical protein A9263_04445 [Vibrio cyclitrophicus]|uniref:hypothetical protein n=1 Tax=Vibrio cyclitrophicus TaxID=47951 RepID=UPI0007EEEB6A|nr:hypothetical protein [Vibrio cyclitrophicus]OBT29312.1 hypothetical protein A9263_04445 [Vibrio cyclitrophicus]